MPPWPALGKSFIVPSSLAAASSKLVPLLQQQGTIGAQRQIRKICYQATRGQDMSHNPRGVDDEASDDKLAASPTRWTRRSRGVAEESIDGSMSAWRNAASELALAYAGPEESGKVSATRCQGRITFAKKQRQI